MDVFLVDRATNLIYNCIVIDSLELALEMYPQWNCYTRTESNDYLRITPDPVIDEVANAEPVTGFLGDVYHD